MANRIVLPALSSIRALLLVPLFSLVAPISSTGRPTQCPDACLPGRYSTEATQVDFGHQGYAAAHPIYSADHRKALRINKNRLWVEVDTNKIATPLDPSDWSWAEIGWAPDSRTFFISHSAGYTTGYRIDIYSLQGGKVRRLANLNRVLQLDFERRHKCFDTDYKTGNDPNIAGLKWMDNSTELLVVAEVPNVGICKQRYFAGYLVSPVSGHIMQRFSPQALSLRWHKEMGENLLSDLQYMSNKEASSAP